LTLRVNLFNPGAPRLGIAAPARRLRYLGSNHWTRKLGSTSGFANHRRVTLVSVTRIDPLPASRPCWPAHDRFYILRPEAYVL
jgi:hypothetical protein